MSAPMGGGGADQLFVLGSPVWESVGPGGRLPPPSQGNNLSNQATSASCCPPGSRLAT